MDELRNDLEDKFRDILNREETILWTGTPNFKTWMSSGVLFLIFGIFWGLMSFVPILMIFFGSTFLSTAFGGMSLFFLLFCIPPMAISLFPFLLCILYVLWLFLSHKNAAYAFTDKRVMIRSGLFGIDYQIIDYDKIRDIQVNINPFEKMCDVGSILFNTGEITAKGAPLMKRFSGIENPYDVFRRIKEVSLDAKTDWNYPNANRPENNPGYNTRYTERE